MSSTITGSARYAAVPQEPADGPITAPLIGIGLWKNRCATMPQTIAVQQQDGRENTAGSFLHESAQAINISASESPLATISRIRFSTAIKDSAPFAAVFDINSGSIALRDVSRFIVQRHVAEEPSVKFPVRSAGPECRAGRCDARRYSELGLLLAWCRRCRDSTRDKYLLKGGEKDYEPFQRGANPGTAKASGRTGT
jgi:hypothetical protein